MLIEPVTNLLGLGIVVILVGGVAAWIPGAIIKMATTAVE